MKVTISYNPQDKKEVLETLYLVSPNTANVTRIDLAKIIQSYARAVACNGGTHSLKDAFSYVDSLNLIGK